MTKPFQSIGLFAKPGKPHIQASAMALAQHLIAQNFQVIFDQESIPIAAQMPNAVSQPRRDIGKNIDLAVVLGGDGTMLAVARALTAFKVPLVGINQGRLGFMTDIPLSAMTDTVDQILNGEFETEQRILLQTSVLREEAEVANALALNDVVISRGGMGSMIEFEVFIDNQFVYSQRSDGLIISTPTGSTAYSLAAGGPILHPSLSCIALVPICPQSMSNRPIVISDRCEVEFMLTRGLDARVHFDGQTHCDLMEMDRVVVHRYRHPLKILHPVGYNYYDMLRHKLHWGERLL